MQIVLLTRSSAAKVTAEPIVPVRVIFLMMMSIAAGTTPAAAQGFTCNRPATRPKPPPAAQNGQMLVQATEVNYDYNNARVAAVGNVQMYYNDTSVEADKVICDQKTKPLHAEGNVRMMDADGKITYANLLDLSDDYRDGFVDSLRVDTADATRMAATRADRQCIRGASGRTAAAPFQWQITALCRSEKTRAQVQTVCQSNKRYQ